VRGKINQSVQINFELSDRSVRTLVSAITEWSLRVKTKKWLHFSANLRSQSKHYVHFFG